MVWTEEKLQDDDGPFRSATLQSRPEQGRARPKCQETPRCASLNDVFVQRPVAVGRERFQLLAARAIRERGIKEERPGSPRKHKDATVWQARGF